MCMTYGQTNEEVAGSLPPGYVAVRETSLKQYTEKMKYLGQLKREHAKTLYKLDSITKIPAPRITTFDSIHLVNRLRLSESKLKECTVNYSKSQEYNKNYSKALRRCRDQVRSESIKDEIKRLSKIGPDGTNSSNRRRN